MLPLAVAAELVATGDTDELGLPLAPVLDEPLEDALLEDCAALLLED